MNTRLFFVFSLVVILGFTELYAQDEVKVPRDPAVNPAGTEVSFSYQGDIWTAPFTGGEATRLTVHEAYEASPRWSPDGTAIAFGGNRFGNNDIFVIPSGGGKSTRITYHSGNDGLYDWTTDNRLLFTSNRVFRQIEWDDEIQSVSADGGTPQRLLNAVGDMPAMSPDGRFVAFVRGSCRISREQYDGPADRDIWIYDTETESYHELTNNSINDFLPRWGDDNTLYFLSASNGRYNIYKQQLNENGTADGSAAAVTRFTDHGVRYFDVSRENERFVFERKAELYTKDGISGDDRQLDIRLSSDYRFDPVEHKTYRDNISEYAVSPNEELIAMTIRGEIFVKPNDEEDLRAVNLSDHPFRDQSPTWLNDSTLIFSSDRHGQYDLFLVRSSDPNKTDIFESLKHEVVRLTDSEEDEVEPQVSPDGKKIVYRQGRGRLITASIDENGDFDDEEILLDGWDTPGGVAWSPDSRWLAYSLSDLNFNSEVYIHAADNSRDPVNFTMHPGTDAGPVWSPDGSKIGFISNRNNNDFDIWFVWLKEEDWEKTENDRKYGYYFDEPEAEEKDKDKDDEGEDEEKEEAEPIEIDFENIHERLWQVTSVPGSEFGLAIGEEGEQFYYTASDPATNGTDLYSIKFDRSENKRLTEGGQNPYQITLGPKGKQLFALKSGRINQVSTSGKFTGLPFNAGMRINHTKENEQIFEEAWSALSQGFYDPDFHGRDWEELKETYKPWALSASTAQDFRYMFNWMLGQVNASHMGLYGSNPEETQEQRTGLLGIEVVPAENGLEVTKVVMNSPADKEKTKLFVGDVITHVEGEPITDEVNFYSFLVNDASEQVLLEVDGQNGSREVVIRPTNSLSTELYEEWVKSRKELTEQYSNGRLGYVHVRAMGWTSFERFERELMASGHDKEGIVIDVRWNGGGWTTDYLMTVLNVRQHAYTVPRGAAENLEREHEKFRNYYPFSERLPEAWWTKPSVALANSSSYSNAEIFSHAYKTLGIGTLVGTPTFGAVISTGGQGLIDGSFVRMPFRAWYVKATDENMENGPAVPDVIIDNAPDSKAKGEDPQLKKAVEVLLGQIDEGN